MRKSKLLKNKQNGSEIDDPGGTFQGKDQYAG
jgi:hypothetical protein